MEKLKYLFTAQFAGGEELFDQNEEDVSAIDPKKSAFYDVLQRIKSGKEEDKLVAFHLASFEKKEVILKDGEELPQADGLRYKVIDGKLMEHRLTSHVAVNLIDGSFTINNFPVMVFEKNVGDPPLTNYRVIFWRKHLQHIQQQSGQVIGHDVIYQLGWQANDHKGNNVQRIIEIT